MSGFTYSKSFGMKFPWGTSVPMREGEKPIHWVENVDQVGLALAYGFDRTFLILTSQRIIYAAVSGGSAQVHTEINLEDVLLATVSNLSTLRVLEKGWQPVEFVSKDGDGLQAMLPAVNEAVTKRRAEISAQRDSGVRYPTDYPSIVTHLEKSGLAVSKLKCLTCGGSIDIPESGNMAECAFCGTALYSQEVITLLRHSFA